MICFHVEEVADGRHYRAVIKSVREKKNDCFLLVAETLHFRKGQNGSINAYTNRLTKRNIR